ncbi:Uncharacterised protein [Mycobacteroides abscessus subsp. abscessus]|nr:Uncharacterised protein [Mycobacteroides abscessus subsp. abscessus]
MPSGDFHEHVLQVGFHAVDGLNVVVAQHITK